MRAALSAGKVARRPASSPAHQAGFTRWTQVIVRVAVRGLDQARAQRAVRQDASGIFETVSEYVEDPMPIRGSTAIPLHEVEVRASRSSGPGGQHANKTASRIEASFDVSASQSLTDAQKRRIIARLGPRVVAVAQDARGQARNRELALQRLAQRLSSALQVSRPRQATRPTSASVKRRLTSKRRRAERKRDRRPPAADA